MKKWDVDKKNPRRFRDWWRRLYHSTKNHMSRGATNVFKTISWARRDNWRRKKK